MLKTESKTHGNAHFFAGTWAQAETFFALNYTISFTGVITFARNYDEIVRKAPLDRLMCETDSPFVAPTPHRGHRNQPDYVIHVAHKIADIRGEDPATVTAALLANTRKYFGI